MTPDAKAAAFGLAAASAGFERAVEVDADRRQGGGEAEEDAGGYRNQECKGEHGAVDADFLEARDVARVHAADDEEAGLGHQQAENAAEDSDQDAFGEELADEAGPAGAEGGADGDFFLASGGAGEQEVGDVGAGDEQHEADRAEQHEHGAADIAYDHFLDADDGHAEGAVPLAFDAHATGDGVDFGLGLLDRDAGLEAGHEVVVFVAAAHVLDNHSFHLSKETRAYLAEHPNRFK